MDLTLGEQRRDFIFIDDVVSAFMYLLERAEDLPMEYQSFDVGSGTAIQVKELVKMIAEMADTTTTLNFGALPYRENEVMNSYADISPLLERGWRVKTGLHEGLHETVRFFRERIENSLAQKSGHQNG